MVRTVTRVAVPVMSTVILGAVAAVGVTGLLTVARAFAVCIPL